MPLWLAGAGGVGREALDVALACGVEVAGFVDDRSGAGEVRGLPVVRPDNVPDGATYLAAIGNPSARIDVAQRLSEAGHKPISLTHPRAIMGPLTEITPGCLVSGGVFISSSVSLGPHVQVHYNATVGHDCVLERRRHGAARAPMSPAPSTSACAARSAAERSCSRVSRSARGQSSARARS